MKKIVLSLVLAVSALAANAQVKIGGQASLWRNTEHSANNTNFTLLPEVGYELDENSEIGLTVGFTHYYNGNSNHKGSATTNAFIVAPYYRANVVKLKNIDLFLEGGLGFATGKVKTTAEAGSASVSTESDAANSYEIGLKPGVAVNLSSKVAFVAHAGFLGYRTTNDNAGQDNVFGSNGFGFGLSSNDLSFGLTYKF